VEKDFNNKDILYFQTDKLQIINPQLAPLHVDGDSAPTGKKFNIKILPAAFNLIIP
jgi:diacylglycerol kinase family enzyme